MPDVASLIPQLLQGGLGNLAAYLAAHVLLCLVPAFFIAGAMTALIPKQTVTRFLGRGTPKFLSYPAAALAGSVLAVCSCTIVPLFAGIHRKGAGIGPAVTFLFFAPAANILALVYTGTIIGPDLAVARLLLSLAFGIGIGLIMALLFHSDDAAHDHATDALFAGQAERGLSRAALAFMLIWVALLLAGTLKLAFLTGAWAEIHLPLAGADGLPGTAGPAGALRRSQGRGRRISAGRAADPDAVRRSGYASWRGFERIQEGWTGWTGAALALTVATLLVAALHSRGRRVRTDHWLHRQVLRRARGPAGAGLARAPAHRRRGAARLAVGVVALREADLPAAGRRRVRGRRAARGHPARVDRSDRRRQHGPGEPGRRRLRRVHVLPDAGRSADREDVPRPRHAPRAAARLPDGGSRN